MTNHLCLPIEQSGLDGERLDRLSDDNGEWFGRTLGMGVLGYVPNP